MKKMINYRGICLSKHNLQESPTWPRFHPIIHRPPCWVSNLFHWLKFFLKIGIADMNSKISIKPPSLTKIQNKTFLRMTYCRRWSFKIHRQFLETVGQINKSESLVKWRMQIYINLVKTLTEMTPLWRAENWCKTIRALSKQLKGYSKYKGRCQKSLSLHIIHHNLWCMKWCLSRIFRLQFYNQ